MTDEEKVEVLEKGVREAYELGYAEGAKVARREGIRDLLSRIDGSVSLDADWLRREFER